MIKVKVKPFFQMKTALRREEPDIEVEEVDGRIRRAKERGRETCTVEQEPSCGWT